MTTITADNVTKTFGNVTALEDVSVSVDGGATVGLLGTNGAGKTTLFKLLLGLDRPDSGRLSVAGVSPDAGVAVRRRVGYLPEHAGFPSPLNGREVLDFHARMRGVGEGARSRRVDETLATVGLADAADRRVGGYSNGMNRRLGLGTALVAEPAVLLLDEPTAGLDPEGVEAFHEVVDRVAADDDITVVFSTHVLGEVEKLCDRAIVLHEGVVRAQGPIEELRRLAGDRVTVRLRLADGADPDAAVAAVDAEVVARRDRVLTVSCPRGEAFDLLADVRDAVELDGFEVREPDLGDAFNVAIAGEPA